MDTAALTDCRRASASRSGPPEVQDINWKIQLGFLSCPWSQEAGEYSEEKDIWRGFMSIGTPITTWIVEKLVQSQNQKVLTPQIWLAVMALYIRWWHQVFHHPLGW
jgi:hypothetical protein